MPLQQHNPNTAHPAASAAPPKDVGGTRPEELLTDEGSWPPFLPSFSAEITQTVDAFVELFICKTIQFRCGQLFGNGFVDVFLAQWLNTALHRRRQLEHLLSHYRDRLSADQTRALFACLRKMQSATRDAEQELGRHRHRGTDKAVSFARPLAYRVARRSNDRLSLRSLPDSEDGLPRWSLAESSSLSPPPDREGGVGGTPCEASPSPPPQLMRDQQPQMEFLAMDDSADGEGERFTGRASGIFYGAAFSHPREEAPDEEIAEDTGRPTNELDELARCWLQRRKRSSTRRLLWYLMAYWVLPMMLVGVLAASLLRGAHS